MDKISIQLVRRPRHKSRRKRRRAAMIIVILSFSAAVVLLAVWLANPFDRDARQGTAVDPGMIAAQLQKEADEGAFHIRVNAEPVFETGGAEGTLFLENPSDNSCNMRAVLTLDETGEKLYESGVLAPGGQELKVKLLETLPKGKHPATVTATALDMQTGAEIGSVQVPVTIDVGG